MSALLYAVEVLSLTKTDIAMLNHLVDRAVCGIFACTSAEDVQFLDLYSTCHVLTAVSMTD